MTLPSKHSLVPEQHALLQNHHARILGHNVRRLRESQNLTKTRFSMMAGITRPTLNKIEAGLSDPQLSVMADLASALDTTVIDLLTPPPAQQPSGERPGHSSTSNAHKSGTSRNAQHGGAEHGTFSASLGLPKKRFR